MNKLLFVAGEPGSGKTERLAQPLGRGGLGLVLHTDRISQRAARHYQGKKSLGCSWQLWKLEFDKTDNRDELETALCKSMEERHGTPVDQAFNVIVEGVLCGHPTFRDIMCAILPTYGFEADEKLTLAPLICWEQLQRNLKTRGRPKDQDSTFAKERSVDYHQRLATQKDVVCFTTTDECYEAALEFLS